MKKYAAAAAAVLMCLLAACGNIAAENGADQAAPADGLPASLGFMPLEYAELFSVEYFSDGSRMISAGTGEHRYLVLPEGVEQPEALDGDVYVLRRPIDRLYIASTSIVSLVDALGALDRVPLVGTDVDGWYLEHVVEAMEAGTIRFGGKFSQPNYEMIVGEQIQLHINNTMVDSKPEVLEKFDELGIPTLVENSSKEPHPLGRVEWIKLLGVLLDLEEEAQRYFDEQAALLEAVRAEEPLGKTVAMGYLAGEKCYARNSGDYCAQLIEMAGGDYVCADLEPEKGGNSTMTFEEWYTRFKDADCLFYMNFTDKFYSIDEMVENNPLFLDFKAVQSGCVWVTSPSFHQSAADIAAIMADMYAILSSEDPAQVTTEHLIKIQ